MDANDAMPPSPNDSIVDALQPVLDCRASTKAEVLRQLDAAERYYESVAQTASPPDDHQASILAACERIIVRLADRNVHMLTPERYREAVERDTQRQRFDVGTLSAIARFIHRLDGVPPPLVNAWTTLREFQPLVELRVLETVGFLLPLGIGPDDRLFVHLGSIAWRGALVLASCENGGAIRHFAARVLEHETDDHGPLLRIAGDMTVLASRRSIHVQCVIFNRPAVLYAGPDGPRCE